MRARRMYWEKFIQIIEDGRRALRARDEKPRAQHKYIKIN
jgi:hypothetical protein